MSKPFHGLTFCCTGILSSQRHDVADKIVALGGTHYTDLMSLVKILVVGNRNTEKYKYSVRYRHDVAFVPVSAILDIHARWTAGDDTGLDVMKQLLPVFENFVVCVARVERPSPEVVLQYFGERFRTPPAAAVPKKALKDAFLAEEIIECMTQNGASVSSTLTPSCTVLVGTDTSGRRYTMARQWGIAVVQPLWVYDSILRGAALHLDDYVVTSDGDNLYNNASFVWKKLYAWRLEQAEVNKKKDPEPVERAPIKKSSEIWSSIMDHTRSHTAKLIRDSTWDDPEPEEHEEAKPEDVVSSPERASPLFLGFKFLPVGFSIPQQKVLKRVVESHQGEIASSADDDTITHILLLVRNGPQASLMLLMLSSPMKRRINSKDVHVVTDWFIERSIFYNEIRHDNWCKPLQGLVPLVNRYKVCISGFTGVELLHIERLVGYLNLEFCEVLNSNRDLLIINVNLFKTAFMKNSPTLFKYRHKDVLNCPVYTNGHDLRSVSLLSAKNKINAAKKWNIPIVSIAYLWEMIDRLAGKANLQVPDILDLSWCIFAPQTMARPTTLLEYVRKLSNNFQTQAPPETAEKSESAQLPSPRKSKDKQKYGRLAGGGESLSEKLKRAQEDDNEDNQERGRVGPEDLTNDTDDLLTQVGYVNQDSVQNSEDLMKKLEGFDERPAKRARGSRNL